MMKKLKRIYVEIRLAKANSMIEKLSNELKQTYVKNDSQRYLETDQELFSWRDYKNRLEAYLLED